MATTTLEGLPFEFEAAAFFAGVETSRLENWIYRDRLYEGGPGRGFPWGFKLADIFKIAAVRALIEDGGLSTTRAVAAVRPHTVYASFLANHPFVLSRSLESGGLIAVGNARRVELHILPCNLWEEMRPRFIEMLPEETAAFEKTIETLRACQETGDWSAMLQQPADPAIAASWEKVIAGLNADTRK